VTLLLQVNQGCDRRIDFWLGRIPLIDIRGHTSRFKRHGGIHEADGRKGYQPGFATELGIDQFRPTLNSTADQIWPDTERVRIMEVRQSSQPLRLC
jgi:hypothetical protein